MDLREQRHVTVLEPVDQVELPQRSCAIERPGHDPRHLRGELLVGRRRRQCEVAHVILEIEVGVVDPVRVVESRTEPRAAATGAAAAGAAAPRPARGRPPARACLRASSPGRAPPASRRARTGAASPSPGTAHPDPSAGARRSSDTASAAQRRREDAGQRAPARAGGERGQPAPGRGGGAVGDEPRRLGHQRESRG